MIGTERNDNYQNNVIRRIMERDGIFQISTRELQNENKQNNNDELNNIELITGMPLRNMNIPTTKKIGLNVKTNYNIYENTNETYNKFSFEMFNTFLLKSRNKILLSPYDILIVMSLFYNNGAKCAVLENILNDTNVKDLNKNNIYRTNFIFTKLKKFAESVYDYNDIEKLNAIIFNNTNIGELINKKILMNGFNSNVTVHTGSMIEIKLSIPTYEFNNFICLFDYEMGVYDDGTNKILEIEMENKDMFGLIIGPTSIEKEEFNMCIKNIKKVKVDSFAFPNVSYNNKLNLNTYLKSIGIDDLYNGILIDNGKYNIIDIIHNVRLGFVTLNAIIPKNINMSNIVTSSFIYYVRDSMTNLILYFGYYNK